MTQRLFGFMFLLVTCATFGCANDSPERGLRDSFFTQLAANAAVKDFVRLGDEATFTGPGLDGAEAARWRVRIDSAVIEPVEGEPGKRKGTVKSTWLANDQAVRQTEGGQRSNLPAGLLANGLAQNCWAAWNEQSKAWEWE